MSGFRKDLEFLAVSQQLEVAANSSPVHIPKEFRILLYATITRKITAWKKTNQADSVRGKRVRKQAISLSL